MQCNIQQHVNIGFGSRRWGMQLRQIHTPALHACSICQVLVLVVSQGSCKQPKAYFSIGFVKLKLLLNSSQQHLQGTPVIGIVCLC